jgi:hypothetical protein
MSSPVPEVPLDQTSRPFPDESQGSEPAPTRSMLEICPSIRGEVKAQLSALDKTRASEIA